LEELTEMQKKVVDYKGGRLFINGSRRSGKTNAIFYLLEELINGNKKFFNEEKKYNILIMCQCCIIEYIISSIRINNRESCVFNKPERAFCINYGNKKINVNYSKEFVPDVYDLVIIDDLYDIINKDRCEIEYLISFLFNDKSNYIVFGTPAVGNKFSEILYYAFYHYAEENKFLINTDFNNSIISKADYNQLKVQMNNNMFETQMKHNVEAMFWRNET